MTMRPSVGSGIGQAAEVSSRFFGSAVSGGVLGWALDSWLGTWPWLVGAGTVAGMALGFYWLVVYAREEASKGGR